MDIVNSGFAILEEHQLCSILAGDVQPESNHKPQTEKKAIFILTRIGVLCGRVPSNLYRCSTLKGGCITPLSSLDFTWSLPPKKERG